MHRVFKRGIPIQDGDIWAVNRIQAHIVLRVCLLKPDRTVFGVGTIDNVCDVVACREERRQHLPGSHKDAWKKPSGWYTVGHCSSMRLSTKLFELIKAQLAALVFGKGIRLWREIRIGRKIVLHVQPIHGLPQTCELGKSIAGNELYVSHGPGIRASRVVLVLDVAINVPEFGAICIHEVSGVPSQPLPLVCLRDGRHGIVEHCGFQHGKVKLAKEIH